MKTENSQYLICDCTVILCVTFRPEVRCEGIFVWSSPSGEMNLEELCGCARFFLNYMFFFYLQFIHGRQALREPVFRMHSTIMYARSSRPSYLIHQVWATSFKSIEGLSSSDSSIRSFDDRGS